MFDCLHRAEGKTVPSLLASVHCIDSAGRTGNVTHLLFIPFCSIFNKETQSVDTHSAPCKTNPTNFPLTKTFHIRTMAKDRWQMLTNVGKSFKNAGKQIDKNISFQNAEKMTHKFVKSNKKKQTIKNITKGWQKLVKKKWQKSDPKIWKK